jgi:hypothetical protein
MNAAITLTDTLVTAPASQALSLEYAKQHIRSLGSADDVLIATYIDAAASYFMEQTGRSLITETRQAGLVAFPFVGSSGSAARIEVPHPPLQNVRSVKYIDGNGTLRSFDDGGSPAVPSWRDITYTGPDARRGFVEPNYGVAWPIARCETDAVRILYDCGYGDGPDDVPPLVRGILCYLVNHFDTYRGMALDQTVTEIPYGVKMMLDGFKYSAYPSQVLREYSTYILPSTWWRS